MRCQDGELAIRPPGVAEAQPFGHGFSNRISARAFVQDFLQTDDVELRLLQGVSDQWQPSIPDTALWTHRDCGASGHGSADDVPLSGVPPGAHRSARR